MKDTLPDPRHRATTTGSEFDFLPEGAVDQPPAGDRFDLVYQERVSTRQSLDWDLSADAMREAAASEFRKRVFRFSLLGVLVAAGLFAIPILQRGNLSSMFDWGRSAPATDANGPAATLPPAVVDTPNAATSPATDANAAVTPAPSERSSVDTAITPQRVPPEAAARVAPTPPPPVQPPKQADRVAPPKTTRPAAIAKAPAPALAPPVPRVEAPKQPPLSQSAAFTPRNDAVPPRALESQPPPTTTAPPPSSTPAQAAPTPPSPATSVAAAPQPTAAASAPTTTPSATDASRTGTRPDANGVAVPSDVNRVRLPSDVNRVIALPSRPGANTAAPSAETAARTPAPPPAPASPATAPAAAPAAAAATAPASAPPASAPTAPAASTSAPASAAAAAPRSAAPIVDRSRDADVRAIEGALARYRSAFNALNARAAAEVWPTVDTRTLTRAFDQLKEQRIAFDGCQTNIKDTRAEAVCTGVTRYVPRIGGRTLVDRRQWTFNLAKVRDDWMIQSVDAR